MSYAESPLDFLLKCGTHRLAHSSDSLLLHLLGTKEILKAWEAPDWVCQAGLYHAVYGTHSFEAGPLVPTRENRARVVAVVGPMVEELVFLYASIDHDALQVSLDESLLQRPTPIYSRDMSISLLNLLIANEAEQFARAGHPLSEYVLTLPQQVLEHSLPAARAFLAARARH